MVNKLTQPLVLITQIQRSGGTLLSQLLDGHPQVCAHPHELHIGKPMKWDWPMLNMRDSPETWFSCLYETALGQSSGPRIGGFIKLYGINKTIKLLENVLNGNLVK